MPKSEITLSRTHRTALVGCLVGLCAVAVAPFFLDTYFTNVLIRTLLLAAVVMTVDILWGYTGILTFGQSAFFGIGAYACGLVFTHYGFGPGWALGGLALALGSAAIVAAGTGWLAFFHGSSPIYASIITLALPIVLTQVIYSGGSYTGSSSGLSGFPTYFWSLEVWFWIAGSFLVSTTTAGWLLVRSDFGRVLVAIRENEDRSAYLGIPVSRIKTMLMVFAAMVASVAGFAYAAFSNVVAPELAGFQLGTELLIWTALGGRATLLGPVFAAIGIDTMSSWLSGAMPFIWKLLTGIAFVGVIVALPRGLAPLISGLWNRLRPQRHAIPFEANIVKASATRMLQGSFGDAPPLRIEGLSRRYGSLEVLSGVNLVGKGTELLGVIGPNGAGKTTLMRCISDGKERTTGTLYINNVEIASSSPQQVVGLGVGRSFQNTNLFETLTVSECLKLARYRIDGTSLFSRSDTIALPQPSLDILQATGLDKKLSEQTQNLSHGMKRGLELAMVLATEPSVLLLDEPTAGLTRPERMAIGSVLTKLTREFGLCIVLIEHDLDFVRAISDRVVVLHQGAILMEGTVEEVVASDLVKAVYAGHKEEEVA
ncbi:branched-chain amino acid ABC transporter substrate-binding protein [Marinobacter vinifirmus]|uniref:Branched-chain amino acid ABC transporter substrate-binding protein n=1 Tax=Marinobacter vinifirmus TaxID=355591 RepID=A0A7Z1IL47_9GAMM|nr:ATP-binding cassette domain-containing protein [Marinobacter vinifirmus]MCP4062658.1 ATP-binding cassette domain-containing protein [Gammaproteobacteria bacterium]MTI78995.1 ATP-binding cassette domain-containing protein [Marinobacter sp.]OZC34750.1 branched-chain amino acid ABC transporter substrate-binding protein [Marinobacter vinifirmus]